MNYYPRVLTIAGSDSGGGAGIQADIKAISATGSYAASAITAVTVQNTLGVEAVHPVPADIIAAQIRCVLSDIGADAIKVGMLHSAEVIRAVRDALLEFAVPPADGSDVSFSKESPVPSFPGVVSQSSVAEVPYLAGIMNIVLDPVMVSTSGHRLIEESAVKVLTGELIPMARVITPNIPEAEILIGRKIESQEELPAVARELSGKYSKSAVPFARESRPVSVLMKAGHLSDDRLIDYFYNAEENHILELPSERIHTLNTHGTGCTLSSAFASYLAQGLSLDDAARAAVEYIHKAIVSGAAYTIGGGHGPVDHFWRFRTSSAKS